MGCFLFSKICRGQKLKSVARSPAHLTPYLVGGYGLLVCGAISCLYIVVNVAISLYIVVASVVESVVNC